MKTIIFIIIASSIGLAWILIENGNSSKINGNVKIVHQTPYEYELMIEDHVLSMGELIREMGVFNSKFKINSNTPFRLFEVIDGRSMRDKLAEVQAQIRDNDIRGMIVCYTLDSRFNLKCYYIPCLARSQDLNALPIEFDFQNDFSNKTLREILNNSTPQIPVFEYIGNQIVATSDDNRLKLEAINNWERYVSHVQVQRNNSERPEIWYNEQQNTNIYKDPMCIYFPLVELDSLLAQNPNDSYLTLVSTSKLVSSQDRIVTPQYRHFIAMYTTNTSLSQKGSADYEKSLAIAIDSIKAVYKSEKQLMDQLLLNQAFVESVRLLVETFKNQAANLGQLCPTKCNAIRVLDKKIIY